MAALLVAAPVSAQVGPIMPPGWTVPSGQNLVVSGSQFITGDFSNATLASRTMFQTSTSGGNSIVGVVPNGAATTAKYRAFGAATPTNAPYIEIAHDGTTGTIDSNAAGAGTPGTLALAQAGTVVAQLGTNKDLLLGVQSAMATNATLGFVQIRTVAGTPSGTPAAVGTGLIPIVYDTSGHKLWSYDGGTWLGTLLSAGGADLPSVVANTRVVGTTTSAILDAYTVGAADSSFQISANVNLTAVANAAFTVTCTYTDESNVSRVLTMGFTQLSGATLLTAITNVTGSGPYESPVYHIRAKAGTTITIASTGTFTSVTYNGEGSIIQIK